MTQEWISRKSLIKKKQHFKDSQDQQSLIRTDASIRLEWDKTLTDPKRLLMLQSQKKEYLQHLRFSTFKESCSMLEMKSRLKFLKRLPMTLFRMRDRRSLKRQCKSLTKINSVQNTREEVEQWGRTLHLKRPVFNLLIKLQIPYFTNRMSVLRDQVSFQPIHHWEPS